MDIWGGKRKLLAKTFMDIAKITVAAAFASEFFLKFPAFVKIAIYIFLAASIVIGFLIHPRGED